MLGKSSNKNAVIDNLMVLKNILRVEQIFSALGVLWAPHESALIKAVY
jgi:hypothetical protein